jgi:hypothetical protein
MEVAKRRGMKRAKVALARKLATVLHRMWVDRTDFHFGKETTAAQGEKVFGRTARSRLPRSRRLDAEPDEAS